MVINWPADSQVEARIYIELRDEITGFVNLMRRDSS